MALLRFKRGHMYKHLTGLDIHWECLTDPVKLPDGGVEVKLMPVNVLYNIGYEDNCKWYVIKKENMYLWEQVS